MRRAAGSDGQRSDQADCDRPLTGEALNLGRLRPDAFRSHRHALDNGVPPRVRCSKPAYRPIGWGARTTGGPASSVRIFFCSDIHASRKCWKKFLNSAAFYRADVIIVGGDITGKFVVPLVEGPNGTRTAMFMGVERTVTTVEEAARLRTWIADAGQYPVDMSPDEYAWHEGDQSRIDSLFRTLVLERVREWVAEADEKFAGSDVRVFVSGANDDIVEVDEVLATSKAIEDPNGRVIDLDDGFQLLGMGWGNPTPWACPRDISEEELGARIDVVAAKVLDPSRAIFRFRLVPPKPKASMSRLATARSRSNSTGSGSVGETDGRANQANHVHAQPNDRGARADHYRLMARGSSRMCRGHWRRRNSEVSCTWPADEAIAAGMVGVEAGGLDGQAFLHRPACRRSRRASLWTGCSRRSTRRAMDWREAKGGHVHLFDIGSRFLDDGMVALIPPSPGRAYAARLRRHDRHRLGSPAHRGTTPTSRR